MDPAAIARVRARDGVTVRQVQDRCVVISLKTGNCWELNPVGFEIWKLFEEGLPPGSVCARVAERYDIATEVVLDDVRALLEALVREGLVDLTPVDRSPVQP